MPCPIVRKRIALHITQHRPRGLFPQRPLRELQMADVNICTAVDMAHDCGHFHCSTMSRSPCQHSHSPATVLSGTRRQVPLLLAALQATLHIPRARVSTILLPLCWARVGQCWVSKTTFPTRVASRGAPTIGIDAVCASATCSTVEHTANSACAPNLAVHIGKSSFRPEVVGLF